MRARSLVLLATLSLLAAGCLGGDNGTPSGGGTPTPGGAGTGGGGNGTAAREIANATLTLSPSASNVLPGSNVNVSMPVNVTEDFGMLVVNTTITQGSSVGLRFSGLGECAFELPAPLQPGRTYTKDCGPVPRGSYNLTYAHTSGSVTLQVSVLGSSGMQMT
jgi:hypothetical protein